MSDEMAKAIANGVLKHSNAWLTTVQSFGLLYLLFGAGWCV